MWARFTQLSSAPRSWLFLAVIVIAQLPLVAQHLRNLWRDPQYQCFPLIILAACLFFYQRRSKEEVGKHFLRSQVLFLAAGLVVFALAVVLHSPWVATAAAVLTLGSVFLHFAVPANAPGLMAAWSLLWFLLPLPMGYGETIRQSMQAGSSLVSSRILDFFSVNHLMYGNVLMAHGERYFVDEACSGMQSVVVMLIIVAIYLVAVRRSLLPSIAMFLITVASCFAMNAIRITAVILLDPMTSVNLSAGWGHEFLGLSIFAVTLMMLFSADGLCMFATAPIFVPQVFERLEDRNSLVRIWNRLFTRTPAYATSHATRTGNRVLSASIPIIAGLFCFVSFTGQVVAFSATPSFGDVETSSLEAAFSLTKDDLNLTTVAPELKLKDFREETRGRKDSNGEHSRVWRIQSPTGKMTVSLDFPFVKFHDLTTCYRNQGWRILSDKRRESEPSTSIMVPAFHEVRMERAPGEIGYLYFGLFNSNTTDGGDGFGSRLLTRSKLAKEPFLQAQCFLETPEDLTPGERSELVSQFIACRSQLSRRIYGVQR